MSLWSAYGTNINSSIVCIYMNIWCSLKDCVLVKMDNVAKNESTATYDLHDYCQCLQQYSNKHSCLSSSTFTKESVCLNQPVWHTANMFIVCAYKFSNNFLCGNDGKALLPHLCCIKSNICILNTCKQHQSRSSHQQSILQSNIALLCNDGFSLYIQNDVHKYDDSSTDHVLSKHLWSHKLNVKLLHIWRALCAW